MPARPPLKTLLSGALLGLVPLPHALSRSPAVYGTPSLRFPVLIPCHMGLLCAASRLGRMWHDFLTASPAALNLYNQNLYLGM
ncbi:hypothetical protein DFH09DRAFT_1164624 [Mycena vulgaris]|nr:hypothetical protein DFH09DRAFT_1164624 [Mycena vulgaris]